VNKVNKVNKIPILTLKNVSIAYGSVAAVENVSFEVGEGDFFCVAGANGSGKSTLIKGILGLTPLAGGDVKFSVERDRVSYVPQVETADRDFPATVEEIVLTGVQRPGRRFPFYSKADRGAAAEAMALFGISDLAGRQLGTLSGGERKRAMLARAMCRDPALLFLDEPCTGLDAETKNLFYATLERLNAERNLSIVMVSHDLDDVKTLADKVAVLARKLVFIGAPENGAFS
jgi:zinc transport system ATP-binding protein